MTNHEGRTRQSVELARRERSLHEIMNQELRPKHSHPADGGSHAFRLEGEYWTIVYDDVVCRLRDTAGLRYLAYLLRRPSEKVAAVELAHAAGPPSARTARLGLAAKRQTELARVKTTRAIRTAMQHIGTHNAPLIEHLRATIRTGAFCSYTPDPRLPVEWRF